MTKTTHEKCLKGAYFYKTVSRDCTKASRTRNSGISSRATRYANWHGIISSITGKTKVGRI